MKRKKVIVDVARLLFIFFTFLFKLQNPGRLRSRIAVYHPQEPVLMFFVIHVGFVGTPVIVSATFFGFSSGPENVSGDFAKSFFSKRSLLE